MLFIVCLIIFIAYAGAWTSDDVYQLASSQQQAVLLALGAATATAGDGSDSGSQ